MIQGILSLCGFGILLSTGSKAQPIDGCPKYSSGSFYIADTGDPCSYYWCVGGTFLQGGAPFQCGPGSGVPPNFKGPTNPCTMHVKNCGAHVADPHRGGGGGGGGGIRGYQMHFGREGTAGLKPPSPPVHQPPPPPQPAHNSLQSQPILKPSYKPHRLRPVRVMRVPLLRGHYLNKQVMRHSGPQKFMPVRVIRLPNGRRAAYISGKEGGGEGEEGDVEDAGGKAGRIIVSNRPYVVYRIRSGDKEGTEKEGDKQNVMYFLSNPFPNGKDTSAPSDGDTTTTPGQEDSPNRESTTSTPPLDVPYHTTRQEGPTADTTNPPTVTQRSITKDIPPEIITTRRDSTPSTTSRGGRPIMTSPQPDTESTTLPPTEPSTKYQEDVNADNHVDNDEDPLDAEAFRREFGFDFPINTVSPPDGENKTSDVKPHEVLFKALRGKYLPQGIPVVDVKTIWECLRTCIMTSDVCGGVDFHAIKNTCWLHMLKDECEKPLEDDRDVIHFRFSENC